MCRLGNTSVLRFSSVSCSFMQGNGQVPKRPRRDKILLVPRVAVGQLADQIVAVGPGLQPTFNSFPLFAQAAPHHLRTRRPAMRGPCHKQSTSRRAPSEQLRRMTNAPSARQCTSTARAFMPSPTTMVPPQQAECFGWRELAMK